MWSKVLRLFYESKGPKYYSSSKNPGLKEFDSSIFYVELTLFSMHPTGVHSQVDDRNEIAVFSVAVRM